MKKHKELPKLFICNEDSVKPILRGALISQCKRYRYQLWRIWDETRPMVLFIMHNPSTADGSEDDPTIRRCMGFARQWGYGGIYVGNLFPFRATNPKELKGKTIEQLSPVENITHIAEMIGICKLHVLAHGNPVPGRVAYNFPNSNPDKGDPAWHYLHLTKRGNPGHPLYLKGELQPIPLPIKFTF